MLLVRLAGSTDPTAGARVGSATARAEAQPADAVVASLWIDSAGAGPAPVSATGVPDRDLAAAGLEVTTLEGQLPSESVAAPATPEPTPQAGSAADPQPTPESTQRPHAPARTLAKRDGQQPRVGLQAGHWRRQEAPAPFNTNTGASGGGKTEAEVNLDVAQRTAALLREAGCLVDVLPTWFSDGYTADVFVAIHADGGPADRRGFFADAPVRSNIKSVEQRLVDLLNEEHAKATGIPYQNRSTPNSRYYYGFDRVNPGTPRALIEMGFLTNAADREVMLGSPDIIARGLANAIIRFLQERR